MTTTSVPVPNRPAARRRPLAVITATVAAVVVAALIAAVAVATLTAVSAGLDAVAGVVG